MAYKSIKEVIIDCFNACKIFKENFNEKEQNKILIIFFIISFLTNVYQLKERKALSKQYKTLAKEYKLLSIENYNCYKDEKQMLKQTEEMRRKLDFIRFFIDADNKYKNNF